MTVCPHVSVPIPMHRGIWYWELLRKFVEEVKLWLKLGKNVGLFVCIPKFVLLLLAALNPHNSALFVSDGIGLLG
jgi:hypothetical protein